MEIEKLNALFASKEMNEVLTKIAKENDFRMCLNKNVVSIYSHYFADIIYLSFVVEISSNELQSIYDNVEKYLANKLQAKLGLKNVYKSKKEVGKYFNEILGNKKFIFHGTTSSMKRYFIKKCAKNYINLKPCKIIDEIYMKYGLYKAFESGISDFEDEKFYVTTTPASACFYALQSPEYFARFASRSDYYKQNVYKYDRIAYYRKDYGACLKNIKTEMKEYGFLKKEKKVVLKNFKAMWKNVVSKNMENVILFKEVNEKNIQRFENGDKLFDMLGKFFTKVHFVYDFTEFKSSFQEIVLPSIKNYLTRQHPIINKKFVIINGVKYFPHFYVDCKYATHNYYTFNKEQTELKFVNENLELNKNSLLIELMNVARPNSLKAKKFLNKSGLPTVSEVVKHYKHEFEKCVNKLEKTEKLNVKLLLISQICEDVGLKYVVCLKYNNYFKNINQYNVYQYRKYLGVKLMEHYEGIPEVTLRKIKELVKLYKNILSSTDFVLNENIPLKIFNKEIEIIK